MPSKALMPTLASFFNLYYLLLLLLTIAACPFPYICAYSSSTIVVNALLFYSICPLLLRCYPWPLPLFSSVPLLILFFHNGILPVTSYCLLNSLYHNTTFIVCYTLIEIVALSFFYGSCLHNTIAPYSFPCLFPLCYLL